MPEKVGSARQVAPCLPAYDGACLTNLISAVTDSRRPRAPWLPIELEGAERVLVLLLDGLGWNQLQTRLHLAPTISQMAGHEITTVAPSTTASALTSITTGLAPGEHGIVGYRMSVDRKVLNVLRWTTRDGDARRRLPPATLQPHPVFGGMAPPVVTRAEFRETGFTDAHLAGVRLVGYRLASGLVVESAALLHEGARFVYAYYDGIDKVAHEFGLGRHYDAELQFTDHLVAALLEEVPSGTGVIVTADHGQVHVGDRVRPLPDDVTDHTASLSGEGRFRWIHAHGGRTRQLHEATKAHFGHEAWVVTRDQVLEEHWFGPRTGVEARRRLGDVAIVPFDPVAYADPDDTGSFKLIARHGSLTRDEMLVPLLVTIAA